MASRQSVYNLQNSLTRFGDTARASGAQRLAEMRSGKAQDLQEKYYQKSMEGMGFQQEQAKDAQLMQNFQLRSATENARIKSTTGKDDPYAATVKAIGSFAPAEQARIQKMLGSFGVGAMAPKQGRPVSDYDKLMLEKESSLPARFSKTVENLPEVGENLREEYWPKFGPEADKRMKTGLDIMWEAPIPGPVTKKYFPNSKEINTLTRDPAKSRAEKLAIMRTRYGFGR